MEKGKKKKVRWVLDLFLKNGKNTEKEKEERRRKWKWPHWVLKKKGKKE